MKSSMKSWCKETAALIKLDANNESKMLVYIKKVALARFKKCAPKQMNRKEKASWLEFLDNNKDRPDVGHIYVDSNNTGIGTKYEAVADFRRRRAHGNGSETWSERKDITDYECW